MLTAAGLFETHTRFPFKLTPTHTDLCESKTQRFGGKGSKIVENVHLLSDDAGA